MILFDRLLAKKREQLKLKDAYENNNRMWDVKKHFAFLPKLVDNKWIWLETYFSYYHICKEIKFDGYLPYTEYYTYVRPYYKRKL